MFEQPLIKVCMRAAVYLGCLLAFTWTLYPVDAQGELTLMVGEVERSYQLHLPPGADDDDALPLVIALHPVASSAGAMAALTGLNTAADDHSFIIAYPDNAGFSWFDGRDLSALNLPEADDVAFIHDLIDHLTETYPVDSTQVYVTGFGNGGMLAYHLACQMPERLAGVAIVGPLLWQHHTRNCPDETNTAVNLLLIHGTDDVIYPVSGNVLGEEVILSAAETLEFWAERHACTSPGTHASIQHYRCAGDTYLTYYPVRGGGQNWPRSGDYRLNQFGVDATEIITAFMMNPDVLPPAPAETNHTDEPPRTYTFYVPPGYQPGEPTALVIALHGRTDSGSGMAYLTDLNTLAEQEGFIAVYPDGLNREWNYGRDIPGYPAHDHDDTQFLADLIHDLSLNLSIDPERIYVTGFSNGGFMVERLACEMPEQYAAFAVVGATGYLGITRDCQDTPAVPILFIHGTEDASVPWAGLTQTSGDRSFFLTLPILRTLEFWLVHNGCEPDYTQATLPQSGTSTGTSVEHLDFTGCPANAGVDFYGVIGGGHNWPGMPDRLPPAIEGAVNMDINASEVIWEFFRQYPEHAGTE